MNIKAKVIADLLKGTLEGDPDIVVHDVAKIEEGKPGTLSFLSNPKYEKFIYETESSVVIVNKAFKAEKPLSTTLIRVDDAYEAFADLLEFHEKSKPKKKGISKLSSIDETAQVGEDIYVGDFSVISPNARIGNAVRIYPQVFIGDDVTVGEGTILYPGVKIYAGCNIGRHCVLHAGVVIGADGFGFAPNQTSAYTKIPQLGSVIIEDQVEIGANTTIDRATMGVTVIRKGVKLDNLIMIGHNVDVGENSVIAGQTGISGSSKVGKNCMIAGQVGLIGHISIADEVKIAAQSGVSKDITEKGEVVQGSAAFNFSQYQKCYVLFKKLPELRKQILALEKDVSKLESGKS